LQLDVSLNMVCSPDFLKTDGRKDKKEDSDDPKGIWQIHEALVNYATLMHVLWPYHYAWLNIWRLLVEVRFGELVSADERDRTALVTLSRQGACTEYTFLPGELPAGTYQSPAATLGAGLVPNTFNPNAGFPKLVYLDPDIEERVVVCLSSWPQLLGPARSAPSIYGRRYYVGGRGERQGSTIAVHGAGVAESTIM
jgi:hypothetical protein